MSTIIQLLTAEDLWQLPRDGFRHELIKGELRTMTPAGFEHGALENKLATLLSLHIKTQQLGMVVPGDTGFFLAQNPDTVRAPDIGFVKQERIDTIGIPKKFFPGAPDLAVEIVSPGDTVNEVDEKVQEWLHAGTQLVWVVNPRSRSATVYRPGAHPAILTAEENLQGGDVVPGFQVRVEDILV